MCAEGEKTVIDIDGPKLGAKLIAALHGNTTNYSNYSLHKMQVFPVSFISCQRVTKWPPHSQCDKTVLPVLTSH